MNAIAWLELELAYFQTVVQHICYYPTGTSAVGAFLLFKNGSLSWRYQETQMESKVSPRSNRSSIGSLLPYRSAQCWQLCIDVRRILSMFAMTTSKTVEFLHRFDMRIFFARYLHFMLSYVHGLFNQDNETLYLLLHGWFKIRSRNTRLISRSSVVHDNHQI